MIFYISYGVTKSASTFAHQLTEEILRHAGHQPARLSTYQNYTDPIHWPAAQAANAEADGHPVVLKTHGAPDETLLALVANRTIFASAILRDPRDIALSMLDHGARCRRTKTRGFADLYSLDDVFASLDDQFARLQIWARCANVLLLTYDEICFGTQTVVEKIADQLCLQVDAGDVLRRFRRKSAIGNFNKGIKDRHKSEMPWEDQMRIIARYRHIYRDYLNMGDVVPCTARKMDRPVFRFGKQASAAGSFG